MLVIRRTNRFERNFKKLPMPLQVKIRRVAGIFSVNPFDPRLKTHKLHGDKKDMWAFSIDYSYRIAFVFVGNNEVLYTDIGTHDQVY